MDIAFIWMIVYLALILFIISLVWRATVALEKIARHLLEIARDFKKDRSYPENEKV